MGSKRLLGEIVVPMVLALLLMSLLCSVSRASKTQGSGTPRANTGTPTPNIAMIKSLMAKLVPLHTHLGPPQPDDWRAVNQEPGQTFAQYVHSNPFLVRGSQRIIYLQPIGTFTTGQHEIFTLTADFLHRYYQLPVQIKPAIPVEMIPESARRINPDTQGEQLSTSYILDSILMSRRPANAAAYVALTAVDLWPGNDWNFVFGDASPDDRVSVSSLARNGDADGDQQSFRDCLLKTIKVAVSQVGMTFSMQHCLAYHCALNGCNSDEERAQRPLEVCPECVAKLWWATGADPKKRFAELAAFCYVHGFSEQEHFYEQSLRAIVSQ